MLLYFSGYSLKIFPDSQLTIEESFIRFIIIHMDKVTCSKHMIIDYQTFFLQNEIDR